MGLYTRIASDCQTITFLPDNANPVTIDKDDVELDLTADKVIVTRFTHDQQRSRIGQWEWTLEQSQSLGYSSLALLRDYIQSLLDDRCTSSGGGSTTIVPGTSNVHVDSTDPANPIISVDHGLFPNGTKIVSASRDFAANDAGYILIITGNNTKLTMPEITPFVEGDNVGVTNGVPVTAVPIGNNSFNIRDGGDYIYPQPPQDEGSTGEVVILTCNSEGEDLVVGLVSTFNFTDGDTVKTALRYLMDNRNRGVFIDGLIQVTESRNFQASDANKLIALSTGATLTMPIGLTFTAGDHFIVYLGSFFSTDPVGVIAQSNGVTILGLNGEGILCEIIEDEGNQYILTVSAPIVPQQGTDPIVFETMNRYLYYKNNDLPRDTYANWDEKRLAGTLPKGQDIIITDGGQNGDIAIRAKTNSEGNGFEDEAAGLFFVPDRFIANNEPKPIGDYSAIVGYQPMSGDTSPNGDLWTEDTGHISYEVVDADITGGVFNIGDTITDVTTGGTGYVVEVESIGGGNRRVVFYRRTGAVFTLDGFTNGTATTGAVVSYAQQYLENGNVFVWNGKHYVIIDVLALDGTNPPTNVTAYQELPKVAGNGYIPESDKILFNFILNKILYRWDKRGNQVNNASLETFEFGLDTVHDVKIEGESCVLRILNTVQGLNGGFYRNGDFAINNANGLHELNECSAYDTFVFGGEQHDLKKLSPEGSTFEKGIYITGLTTFDITTANNWAGIFRLLSNTAVDGDGKVFESIDKILNPPAHKFRIYPESVGMELTVTPTSADVAGVGDIVLENSAAPIVLKHRANGFSDYLEFQVDEGRNGYISQVGGRVL